MNSRSIEDMDFLGICPFCANNDTDYGYEYQWDYCPKAANLKINDEANGVCTGCDGFVPEVREC